MTTLAPPATIAFIGLGMMGRPMAARLAEAGYKLRLFDVSQKAVSDFIGAHPSALATASPKAAAQGADALITMLPDGKVVRQALIEGRDAAREGLAPGSLVLDMSSSNPVDTQKLARDLAAAGSALLDAPVSGGVKRAVDGSLSIMVGGAAADLERARPAFAAMGKTITLCGAVGAGHAMKALNNYLSAAGFTTGLMAKDLRTAGDVAEHLDLNMPMLKHAAAYWADANARLGAAADHTEIFRYAEMLAEEEP